MSKSRAERRHHHNRMIDKVKKFDWLKPRFWFWSEEERELHIKKMAETRHPCSCYMCGNPRKYFKDKTMQEKRFDEKMKTDWDNLKGDWNKIWNDDERG